MRPATTARITSLLYDGVLDPCDWHAGMAAFGNAVGACDFHLLTTDLAQGAVLESIASIAPGHEKAVQEYEQHYALIDERVPIAMRMGPGQVMLDHEHFSDRHISRSALYTDCLAPQGMKHTMGLMLRVQGSVQQYVGFMRRVDQPHFSDADRRLALHLLPDVVRAAQLRARVDQLARHAALGLAALDTLAQAVAVLDARCRIQYCNAAAERLLARPGALGVRCGQLHCHDSAAQARWQALVAAACARQGGAMAGALQPAPGPRGLVVTVLPLNAHHLLAPRHAPMALAVMGEPAPAGGPDPRLVSSLLGLSPTETRLALLLAAGATVKDFAAAERVSWHTARTHAKNLLRKSGCHRQVDLVRLLLSLPAC